MTIIFASVMTENVGLRKLSPTYEINFLIRMFGLSVEQTFPQQGCCGELTGMYSQRVCETISQTSSIKIFQNMIYQLEEEENNKQSILPLKNYFGIISLLKTIEHYVNIALCQYYQRVR